jgi:hypothetical protein
MIDIFVNVLAGAGTLCTLMGLFVFVKTLVLPNEQSYKSFKISMVYIECTT